MSTKRIKRVIITGAGFSAPARLPIQSRIIDKMIEEPQGGFLDGTIPRESYKFLDAYIIVGLFLLNQYGKSDYSHFEREYSHIREIFKTREILFSLANRSEATDPVRGLLLGIADKEMREDDRYSYYYSLREKIRKAIKQENINVNLEDIFTSFDKSVLSREYLHQYTYEKMDAIRISIIRLFAYYFSKCVQEHTCTQKDYLDFTAFIKSKKIKTPAAIITTNWDTLVEKYFLTEGVKFYYGFHSPYTSEDFGSSLDKDEILLLKVHGSANWLKCQHCGAVSVFPNNTAAASLFEDGEYERCAICGSSSVDSSSSLQPEIITPSMVKSLSNRIFLNLWGAAANEIRNATHVLFIGYSFPIADFELRYLLQRNMPPDAIIDVILYHNDDPDQTTQVNLKDLLPEKRYRDAFPRNEINFCYEGFGSFFKT